MSPASGQPCDQCCTALQADLKTLLSWDDQPDTPVSALELSFVGFTSDVASPSDVDFEYEPLQPAPLCLSTQVQLLTFIPDTYGITSLSDVDFEYEPLTPAPLCLSTQDQMLILNWDTDSETAELLIPTEFEKTNTYLLPKLKYDPSAPGRAAEDDFKTPLAKQQNAKNTGKPIQPLISDLETDNDQPAYTLHPSILAGLDIDQELTNYIAALTADMDLLGDNDDQIPLLQSDADIIDQRPPTASPEYQEAASRLLNNNEADLIDWVTSDSPFDLRRIPALLRPSSEYTRDLSQVSLSLWSQQSMPSTDTDNSSLESIPLLGASPAPGSSCYSVATSVQYDQVPQSPKLVDIPPPPIPARNPARLLNKPSTTTSRPTPLRAVSRARTPSTTTSYTQSPRVPSRQWYKPAPPANGFSRAAKLKPTLTDRVKSRTSRASQRLSKLLSKPPTQKPSPSTYSSPSPISTSTSMRRTTTGYESNTYMTDLTRPTRRPQAPKSPPTGPNKSRSLMGFKSRAKTSTNEEASEAIIMQTYGRLPRFQDMP